MKIVQPAHVCSVLQPVVDAAAAEVVAGALGVAAHLEGAVVRNSFLAVAYAAVAVLEEGEWR